MHLPHLVSLQKTPIVFLTVCTRLRVCLLADEVPHSILRDVWRQSAVRNGWFVGRYVLMPDHVHLFAQVTREACALADWVRIWKSISATRINRHFARCEPLWQSDYFDRYLRSTDDYRHKWEYVLANPVRKGLAPAPAQWPFAGVIHELRMGTRQA
ncbi:MAG TPA: transposase [Lacunisphaera sp.]|jgi:REP element-mobilizing transposase RayT|nr:transposase [Lacunisphaera sp.]